MRRLAAALAALAVTLALPSIASAHELSIEPGGVLTYSASPGERNSVEIFTDPSDPSRWLFSDAGAARVHGQIHAIAPCVRAGATAASCPKAGVTGINFLLRDSGDTVLLSDDLPASYTVTVSGEAGNDQIEDQSATAATLNGGDGNDTLRGGSGDNRMFGGVGNDVFSGGAGNDLMRGEGGADRFDERLNDALRGAGSDMIEGGSDRDEVSYALRQSSVGVTLDDRSGDGESGERDNVGDDVEIVIGGTANDRLGGSGRNETLIGGGGNDRIVGGDGNDTLRGGAGDDSLAGQLGNDRLIGNKGRDRMSGGRGRDLFSARDGARDLVIGGANRDRGSIDRRRDQTRSFEGS